MELDLSASVAASLDTAATALSDSAHYWQRIQAALTHIPMDTSLQGSHALNATGAGVFSLGGPSVGRLWQVRRLAVGGLTKGKVRVYATAGVPDASGAQISDLVDVSSTWPNVAFYSTHQFVVIPNAKVWVVVVTGTATGTAQMFGAVEDYDLAAYRGTVDL